MVPYVKFDFDSRKSVSNKAKHGIDFVEAQALWTGVTVEIQAKTVHGEPRYAVLGEIRGVAYTVIITYRGAMRRIISAHVSSKNEAEFYAAYKTP